MIANAQAVASLLASDERKKHRLTSVLLKATQVKECPSVTADDDDSKIDSLLSESGVMNIAETLSELQTGASARYLRQSNEDMGQRAMP